ncbi:hypothetical protein LCGC14_1783160 [marine sediment metagenome]|uniref:Uncharacterized protein n=1 Tax=marine sediment metagenome TaxID=412755 RepID=A0A0F9GUW3_9ZZZZ
MKDKEIIKALLRVIDRKDKDIINLLNGRSVLVVKDGEWLERYTNLFFHFGLNMFRNI